MLRLVEFLQVLIQMNQRNVKRHPTLKDNVVVGSGAQVLGPIVSW